MYAPQASAACCQACKKSINSSSCLQALRRNFHIDCFRCLICGEKLSPSLYYGYGSELLCRKDYLVKFASVCHHCGIKTTGPVMVIGDHKFHTECFSCNVCKRYLADEDDYVMVERHRLLCGDCYRKDMNEARHDFDVSSWHTIHHLHLVPDQSKQRKIGLNVEVGPLSARKTSVDTGNSSIFIKQFEPGSKLVDPKALQEGDKVLELNGIQVNNDNVEKVGSTLLSKPGDIYQITLERPPRHNTTCTINIKSPSTPNHHHQITKSPSTPNSLKVVKHQDSFEYEDDEKAKQRAKSISFFSKKTFLRSGSNAATGRMHSDTRQHQIAHQHSVPVTDDELTCEEMNVFRQRATSMPRSNSLSDVPKVRSPLFRVQSFKHDHANNRVFRTKDLLIGEEIGRGFFGQVLKVTHKQTGEVMVMKELLNFNKEDTDNFLKEVSLLKSLHHPHVLRFIGILYKGQILNLITEYISGGTLRKVLDDKIQPLSWTQKVKFCRDIAEGMAYLHEMCVMHRDLNSNNCLVRNDEGMSVVVADFGLARITEEEPVYVPKSPRSPDKPPGPRKRYTVVGTPYWMAPEMLNGRNYDERVDVFSYGIVMCEIIGQVSADPDFLPRTSVFGVDEERFCKQYCAECPEVLYKVAFKCASLKPDNRPSFQTIETWMDAIMLHLEVNLPLPSDIKSSLLCHS